MNYFSFFCTFLTCKYIKNNILEKKRCDRGIIHNKVAALSFKPEVRLRAKKPSSEHMSQSDELKKCFGTRLCVRANLVSVYS